MADAPTYCSCEQPAWRFRLQFALSGSPPAQLPHTSLAGLTIYLDVTPDQIGPLLSFVVGRVTENPRCLGSALPMEISMTSFAPKHFGAKCAPHSCNQADRHRGDPMRSKLRRRRPIQADDEYPPARRTAAAHTGRSASGYVMDTTGQSALPPRALQSSAMPSNASGAASHRQNCTHQKIKEASSRT